ncbi:MAG: hypothetical protein GX664_05285 [Bacteroidales bacterium]|jgi:cell division protein FtsB|nr:hypothetical protein [Bacteroidales bacterium]
MALFKNFKERLRALKERSLLWRLLLNIYFLATLIFLIIIGVLDRNNALVLSRSLSTLSEQKKQEIRLRQSIDETSDKINQLTSNADTLEMFAREQYYFQEDGESVYIVEYE